MVGYQEGVRQDESLAKHLLDKQRSIIRKALLAFRGRDVGGNLTSGEETGLRGWIKGAGTETHAKLKPSESIVLFDSTLDAIQCAVEIQQALKEHNREAPSNKDIYVKIGIHVGEVVQKGAEVIGSGIRVASQIESLTDSGGICLSLDAYNQVKNVPEYVIERLDAKLENSEGYVEAYRLVLPWHKNQRSFLGPTALDPHRIAILPLTNISSDPDGDYFADGMTEEMITALSNVHGLEVIARTSVMKFKKSDKGIAAIAQELRAGTILEGSVRKAGDKVRVTIQLVNPLSEGHVWAKTYDRQLLDIFLIQSDIAQNVSETLQVQLLPRDKEDIERKPPGSPEAYILYLKGRYYWNERTEEATKNAINYFQEAMKLEPGYALAYSGLADCYVTSADRGWMRPREAVAKSKAFALKAVELEDRSAEAHASLAIALTDDWDLHSGEIEVARAIELKPSYATAHQWHGIIMHLMDRQEEAYNKANRARELDPLSLAIGMNLGGFLFILGRFDEAVREFNRLLNLYPNSPELHHALGVGYLYSSMGEEAIKEERKAVELSKGAPRWKCTLAFACGLSGKKDEAREILGELARYPKNTRIPPVDRASALLAIGQEDEAFDLLDQAYEDRDIWLLHFRVDPWYKQFHSGPRWANLARKIDTNQGPSSASFIFPSR